MRRARILPVLPTLVLTVLFLAGCLRDFGNPSDPEAQGYMSRSRVFLERLEEREPVEGDTVRLRGGVTSSAVEAAGLVREFAWDLDGDGDYDTTLDGTDTLAFRAGEFGSHSVGLRLTDKAGFQEETTTEFRVHPGLPRLFEAPRYDTGCPVYAQEPALMRLVLAMSHFATERTREEGIGATDFILKLARALTGTAFPVGLLDGFDYSFSRGVYHFESGSLFFDVAFHYGPGMPGQAEGDTIRADLFDVGSYVRNIRVTGFPPVLRWDRGPLADLVQGDIKVDADDFENPTLDFRVDFNRVRLSLSRGIRTPLVLANAEITLANALFFALFEGRARLAPLYPGDVAERYGRDSLELDFAGTRVTSPDLPIRWRYTVNGASDSAVYRVSLRQETLRQIYRFGDAGGVRKVFGEYSAVNRLDAGAGEEEVYFQGSYSSTAPDSARFHCKEAMAERDEYGQAAFETESKGRGHFASKRYSYAFGFPYSTVEPWNEVTPPKSAIP